ncbi:hypothetical protein L6R29_11605 [Myxococcota bacterium]|nr:hypothetical protein [Myxococcota bacterium]
MLQRFKQISPPKRSSRLQDAFLLLSLLFLGLQQGCTQPEWKPVLCDTDGKCGDNQSCITIPRTDRRLFGVSDEGSKKACLPTCDEKNANCFIQNVKNGFCVNVSTGSALVCYPCENGKAEVCNGQDDDCDGLIDNEQGGDRPLARGGEVCTGGNWLPNLECDKKPETPTQCGSSCTNLRKDANHCGECGKVCLTGQKCIEGACSCDPGQKYCGDTCVNIRDNPQHCGDCNNACDQTKGLQCLEGQCACKVGEENCGGSCVDTQNRREHCGACGKVCRSDQSCNNGECQCPPGQKDCDGSCKNTVADPANCGQCGKQCGANSNCKNSECQCDNGFLSCSGVCASIQDSVTNCGACGVACRQEQVCRAGLCQCGLGEVECGGSCKNVSKDPDHCGQCSQKCPFGSKCQEGVCLCPSGYLACSGTCVNAQESLTHCGGCGVSCRQDQTCRGGLCQCPLAGQTECSGSCVDTRSNDKHCGSCGNVCPAGQPLCSEGVCKISCPSTQLACGSSCKEIQTDIQHCGACGNKCDLTLEKCDNGSCKCKETKEICQDNLDNNCNGQIDEGCPWVYTIKEPPTQAGSAIVPTMLIDSSDHFYISTRFHGSVQVENQTFSFGNANDPTGTACLVVKLDKNRKMLWVKQWAATTSLFECTLGWGPNKQSLYIFFLYRGDFVLQSKTYSAGNRGLVIASLDMATGNTTNVWLHAKNPDAAEAIYARGFVVNSQHEIFVWGARSNGDATFTGATGSSLLALGGRTYLAKINNQGSVVKVWQPKETGGGIQHLKIDQSDNLFAIGLFHQGDSMSDSDGSKKITSSLQRGVFVAKFDKNLVMQSLHDISPQFSTNASTVINTYGTLLQGAALFVSGNFTGQLTSLPSHTAQTDLFVCQFSLSNLTRQWCYTPPAQEGDEIAYSLFPAPQNGLYAGGAYVGKINLGVSVPDANGADPFFLQLDPAGKIVRAETVRGGALTLNAQGVRDEIYRVDSDSQGNMYALGSFYANGVFSNIPGRIYETGGQRGATFLWFLPNPCSTTNSTPCPGLATCVDIQTNNLNCGSCGRSCGSGQSCVNGICQ